MRDFRSDRYTNSHPRRDFAGQSEMISVRNVGAVFRELVHQVLEKIKDEPYFRWPNKMGGESAKQTRTCIANPTRTMDIPRRIAGTYGIIWTSWSKKES